MPSHQWLADAYKAEFRSLHTNVPGGYFAFLLEFIIPVLGINSRIKLTDVTFCVASCVLIDSGRSSHRPGQHHDNGLVTTPTTPDQDAALNSRHSLRSHTYLHIHATMSWQAYVDSSLLGTGKIDKAGLYSRAGE